MTKKNKSIRDVFGESLVKFGKKNKKIFAISPDLKSATKLSLFKKEIPERFIETGIAEANAIGIASGLAMSGLKPVVANFGSFLSGKNIEIRVSIGFNNAPVVLVGTHGGLIGPDGPTQAGLQDISVMRSIPNIKIFQPASAIETTEILRHCLNLKVPGYIRISRQANKEIYKKNYKFIEGKAYVIKNDMKDGVIFTSGNMVERCSDAANMMKEKYKIGVVNIPSIKPLNTSSILKIISKTKKVFSVEDHSINGGLGSTILELISEHNVKKPLYLHGLKDFTQSGGVEELYKYYNLDGAGIAKFLSKNY